MPNRLNIAFRLLFALPLLTVVSSATAKSTTDRLIQAEKDIGRANLNCDYDFFRKIEAPESFFTDSSGAVTTREEDLAGESTCKKRDGTFNVSETRVLLYGNTAVISALGTYEMAGPERKIVRTRITDVFVKRHGSWTVVAGHSSRLKDAAPK